MGAVKNAMERDGLNASIMHLDPGKSVASQLEAEEEEDEPVDDSPPLKEDPTYVKVRAASGCALCFNCQISYASSHHTKHKYSTLR